MSPLLPSADTAASFDAVRRDEAALGPGVRALCARHGLSDASIERFADGSLPVYAVGDDRVLKLYPPVYRCDYDIERAALEHVAGRLPIPTPTIVASGTLEGWSYVLLTRLEGASLASVWDTIPPAERLRLMRQLGEAIAALHALPFDAPALAPLAIDWDAFVRTQRDGCVARQRAAGLDERWLAQVPAYLDRAPPAPTRRALLHTELMREHVFAARRGDGWALTGVLDFEPSMLGDAGYEFASVGVFVTCGDPELLRALLLGYGSPDPADDAALQRAFMTWALLHRFSNLAWYLRRVPPGPAVRTLDELAAHWWALPSTPLAENELPEHVRRNRGAWDQLAADYVASGERNWATDAPTWGVWSIPEAQAKLLPADLAGKDVIELGCGTAYLSAWLARRGARVTGIDNSPKQLETARRLQREHGLEFPLLLGNAEAVPLPDASFDVTISEYGASIWADPYRWVPEAARLLRPDGELIFMVNGTLTMLTLPDREADGPAGEALRRPYFEMHRFEWADDDTVEFHLGYGDWIRLLRAHDFEVIDLVELRPEEGATTRYTYVTVEWARKWPSEQVWKARKRGRSTPR